MLKTYLVDPSDKKKINIVKDIFGNSAIQTLSFKEAYGSFNAVSRSTAGTTVVVTTRGVEAIGITDIILTADKKNAGTVVLRFNDGSVQVNIVSAGLTDAPMHIYLPVSGKFIGWQSANIEIVTNDVFACNICLGYFRIPQNVSMTYSEWLNAR